jgi:predicted lipoprotein with Yx(FWY)xxD motif
MNIPRTIAWSIAVPFLLAACASYTTHAASPAKVSDGVLTAGSGMTLYVFDKDAAGSGKSVCNGPCAANWPPLLVADGETAGSDYGIVTRDDGKKQWSYKGKPLYFWGKDMKPGDRTGDGFNNVWHVAKP